jgi:phosphohistidine phosphatase
MNVILFRHGPAGDPDPSRWPNDADRPLTPRGIEKTRAAARGLRRHIGSAAFILTSPYVRALGTARVVADVLGVMQVETLDALACGGSPRAILTALSRMAPDQTVILVGHEPDLGVLAGNMIGAGRSLPLKKAGACEIEFLGEAQAGSGELIWFASPKLLRRIAGKHASTA